MAVINPGAYGGGSVLPNINPTAYTGTAFGQPVYNQYRQTQEPDGDTIKFVRGINEAASYPANKPILLMDANDPVFYIKDPNGLRVFDYKERVQSDNASKDYVTRSEFEELKKMLDELTK